MGASDEEGEKVSSGTLHGEQNAGSNEPSCLTKRRRQICCKLEQHRKRTYMGKAKPDFNSLVGEF
jgi:hypothetical protein